MAFTCGFYNGPNRMYNAEQLSSIFDGIISDGMYSNYRNSMIVIESENDNEVIVQPGRAWLMHTWSLVDANLPIEAPQSEVVLDRIDALVIDVNTNPEVKNNEITWVTGTPASKDPQKPVLVNEQFHKQYPLCYIYRAAGTTSIAQENITNAVGTSELPFVTGIIDTINTDQLILKWEAQWETFMKTYTSEAETWIDTQEGSFLTWSTAQRTAFETWFESIRGILDQDAAGHIMNIIDARIPAYDSENPAQQITAVRSRKGNYISELRVYANAKPRLFQSADGGQTWEDSSVGGFEPVEISYEAYLALTDEEKDAGDWYVVGMPSMGLNAKTIPYSGNVENAKNVEDAIDDVNQNLTYRWNPTTDYFEHYKNGQWIQDKFAGFNGIFYMKNGTVSTIAQGASAYPYIASGQQGYTAKAVNAVKQGDYMVISDTGGAYSGIYAFANPVKCAEISKVKITLSGSKTSGGYTMNANLNFMTPLADGFTTIVQIGDVFGGSATELSERVIELTLPNTTQEGYIGFALKSYLGTITLNIKDVELVPR